MREKVMERYLLILVIASQKMSRRLGSNWVENCHFQGTYYLCFNRISMSSFQFDAGSNYMLKSSHLNAVETTVTSNLDVLILAFQLNLAHF